MNWNVLKLQVFPLLSISCKFSAVRSKDHVRYGPVERYDGPPGFTQAFATTSSKFFPAEQVPSFLLDTARSPEGQLLLVRMISQTWLLEVVRRSLWDAARLLNLGHPETSKTMNIWTAYEHHDRLSLKTLRTRNVGVMVNSFRCRKWVLNCNPRCQGNLGKPVGKRMVKFLAQLWATRRSRPRSLRNHPFNDSQYSRNIWLGHWECLNKPSESMWVYCSILRPACRSWPVALLRPLSLQECCMQEVFPKSHQ